MKSLLLTLGHNSSGILVDDVELRWGYETERLSGKKSDSAFPVSAVATSGDVDMAYVTHWSPTGSLGDMSEKHWQPVWLSGVPMRTLSTEFTHHDAHLWSAMHYAGPQFPYGRAAYGLVIDGFGNFGEHFSVYRIEKFREPKLVRRFHGYGTSLGLWYQYATAFMGMKMHEDEYKLLGYEAHVLEADAVALDEMAEIASEKWLDWMYESVYGSAYDPVYNVDALPEVRRLVFEHLGGVMRARAISDPTATGGRIVLSYYVQQVLERVVRRVIEQLAPDARSLLCAGGVFYNVKLNKILLDLVAERGGQFCVNPLAGDQGAALGLYFYDRPGIKFPADLCWGRRALRDVGHIEGVHFVGDELAATKLCSELLASRGVVNLVRGSMEFGPRALCNTSTLALPTRAMVEKINAANERNTVMPMAPVMTHSAYAAWLERAQHVWRSAQHMIVAMELAEHPLSEHMGVVHEYNHPHKYHTCRPQVASGSDALMQSLLRDHGGVLINTSFNFHGKPIAFDMPSIVENHMLQNRRDADFHTVVVTNA